MLVPPLEEKVKEKLKCKKNTCFTWPWNLDLNNNNKKSRDFCRIGSKHFILQSLLKMFLKTGELLLVLLKSLQKLLQADVQCSPEEIHVKVWIFKAVDFINTWESIFSPRFSVKEMSHMNPVLSEPIFLVSLYVLVATFTLSGHESPLEPTVGFMAGLNEITGFYLITSEN